MNVADLNDALDNIGVYYSESGASYDCDWDAFQERQIELLEQEHAFTHIEF